MRLSFDDIGLSALDALRGVDALCLFVGEEERPLRGLSGFVDWRLCGGLSRILKSGRFAGEGGDTLLLPTPALRVPRLFCFGLGQRARYRPEAWTGDLFGMALAVLSRAGCRSAALEVPGLTPENGGTVAGQFLSGGLPAFKGERLVLIGAEAKALARLFNALPEKQASLQIDPEPLLGIR